MATTGTKASTSACCVSLRVRAVTEGVVQRTGYENGYEGYGKIIVLNLPGPYIALYAHLVERRRPGR